MNSKMQRKRTMGCGTVVAVDLELVARETTKHLSANPAVKSVHFLPTDTALSVWVAITKDDMTVRSSIYGVEDQLSKLFPSVLFDFHAVPVPAGRQMEDFVSAAKPIFRRTVSASAD